MFPCAADCGSLPSARDTLTNQRIIETKGILSKTDTSLLLHRLVGCATPSRGPGATEPLAHHDGDLQGYSTDHSNGCSIE